MTTSRNGRVSPISLSPQQSRPKSSSSPENILTIPKGPLKRTKRRHGYTFAPFKKSDTLKNCNNNDKLNALVDNIESASRSISIKRVENGVLDKEVNQLGSKTSSSSITNQENIDINVSRSYSDGPSEEVIWKFSPRKHNSATHAKNKDVEKDCFNIADYNSSSDLDGNIPLKSVSSTPIMSGKFKSILNFLCNHSNESRKESPEAQLGIDTACETSKVTTSAIITTETIRDIDDIINDIVEDIDLRTTQFPSSPDRIEERSSIRSGTNMLELDQSFNKVSVRSAINMESDEDDDSLIDILSQKFNKPKQRINELSKDGETKTNINKELGSSDMSFTKRSIKNHLQPADAPKLIEDVLSDIDDDDDSLMCYFEENDMTKPQNLTSADDRLKLEFGHRKTACSTTTSPIESLSQSNKLSQDFIEKRIKDANCGFNKPGIIRLVIVSVQEFAFTKGSKQKILKCVDKTGYESNMIVRTPWVDLEFSAGDVVNLIEGKNAKNKRLLSNDIDPVTGLVNDNLLIHHPDLLLSATSIGDSIECIRRSVINYQIQQLGEPNIHMLIGNIVHELIQDILLQKIVKNELDDVFISTTLDRIIEANSLFVLISQQTKDEIKDTIFRQHVNNIKQFALDYIQEDNSNCKINVVGHSSCESLSISNVVDIEESIWSPIFGMKGFIDATVEAHVGKNTKLIAPLEVKTGKWKSVAHEVQGSIYTMLLSDRYDIPVEFHLMYYSQTNNFIKHPRLLYSLKHLLVLRNRLAGNLKYNLQEITYKNRDIFDFKFNLPSLLRSSTCDNCGIKEKCMVLNKICEDGTADKSGLQSSEYDQLTGHLSKNIKKYTDFFQKHNNLLQLEESSINNSSRQLFLMTGKDRELESGKCLHGMVVSSVKTMGTDFYYKFVRGHNCETITPLTNTQLSHNDTVYISDEAGHFALATGLIQSISTNSITLICKRRFDRDGIRGENFNKSSNQIIKSVLIQRNGVSEENFSQLSDIRYRLDFRDKQYGLAIARFNLLNLFLPDIDPTKNYINEQGKFLVMKKWQGGDSRMRRLLVEGKPPRFSKKPLVNYTLEKDKFNSNQLQSIDKAMRCKDYALILGMPGTGKTTIIAEIIKILAANNKSVLLTTYTHSAVDNILQKLVCSDLDIIRLGCRSKIHHLVRHFHHDFSAARNFSELESMVNLPRIFATTCLGINDPILSLRSSDFDYVILDEASQVSMPIALGPIRFGSKFILVGDHNQLPPLVKNEIAKNEGLDETLFKMLSDAHPSAVVELTYQYRMHSDIMALSNELVYKEKLKCGSLAVAQRTLNLKIPSELLSIPWLRETLDPSRTVLMLDYDNIHTIQEIADKDNIRNPGEVLIIKRIVSALIQSNLSVMEIGVIALYRSQLRLMSTELSSHSPKLDILTADQFQGREKECIIISTVRSNSHRNPGYLLRDLRRVNVAMSRAKSKLILVCSKRTISTVKELKGLLNLFDTNNWVYALSSGDI